MSTFFRKRPPYSPRTEHAQAREEDFPVIGPAAESMLEENNDYPVLEPEVDDVPVVAPTDLIDSTHLASALEAIIKEEMTLAEKRIRQRILTELKKYIEN